MQKGVKLSTTGQTGVTIIELLVVMAIIGIIAVIGVNMMGGVISKQRLRTAASEVQTRLRVAQMLSVVKNESVTVVFVSTAGIGPGQEDVYFACLDSDHDGDCADEPANKYLNLDSGRTSSLNLVIKELHPLVEMYDIDFGADTPDAVTFMPPSGLPRRIEDAVPAPVNGAVCIRVEAGDAEDGFSDQYEFRRITVDPLVGKAIMWKAIKPVPNSPNNPTCNSQLDDEWEKVFQE